MPRPSAAEAPRRQSPRGSLQLRTSSSDSDSSHHRPLTDRSPMLGDRRSPRSVQSNSVNQKKLGTRIAGLESQLGQAQEELKCLKEQLASAEAAKKEAQEQLQKKAKKKSISENPDRQPRRKSSARSSNVSNDENQKETDVFEVPTEREAPKSQEEVLGSVCETQKPIEAMEILAEPSPLFVELGKDPFDELVAKDEEIGLLKSRLEEKEKELEVSSQEKDIMKKQLEEVNEMLALARTKEEEASTTLARLEKETTASKEDNLNLKSKLELVEGEKDALETEMKTLRVQTEQWRKAADAAAAVLAGGVGMDGRCGSMEKHCSGGFEMSGTEYADDGYEGGRRKHSGIKVFGDLWKKMGH
ncbi:hypothetical protein MLD38_002311 [Melastoma candidum]|uniref:Uncharacterized protein n=1 Tax=Melastoma candidum TaxID=119954 RepID=A0ACB9SPL7_9MYRT|nr:hypothetical protein MLD38_002311 [Melastoma candidum]